MESMKPTNVRWGVFIAILILCTVNYLDRAVLSVCMPLIQTDLMIDPAIVGVVLSSFFWGYTLMQIPVGWLSDRFRPDRIIITSGILWGIWQICTGFVSSSKLFMLFRALLGITESPIFPIGAKLQSIWLTSEERGRGSALLDCGGALGTALGGPLVVLFLAWFGGWRAAIIGTGILTIIVVLSSWFAIKGTPDTNSRVNASEREYIKKALDEEYKISQRENSSGKKVNMKAYLHNANFWYMCAAFFGYDGFWFGLMTWGPNFLAATQHLDIKSVGASVFIIFGAGVVGELSGGYFTDKWRMRGGKINTVMRTLFGVQGVIMAAMMYFLSQATSLYMAIGLLAIAMFFGRWAGALTWNIPAAIGQREHVGVLAGCMNFAGNIAGIVTPIIVGVIVSVTQSYFWALMLFICYALMLSVFSQFLDFSKKIGSDTP